MPQDFPIGSLIKYPVVGGNHQVGLVRSYNPLRNTYNIIPEDGSETTFRGSQLQERVRVEGDTLPSATEDDWQGYLPLAPLPISTLEGVVDPGEIKAPNDEYDERQRHNQAMLRVERDAAKEIDEQIEAKKRDSLSEPEHHLGCIRAGMTQAKQEPNPILRWIAFVMAYASTFSNSFTNVFTLWVAKQEYWQTEITRAGAGARKFKHPLLFMIISKCSADDY